MAVDKSEKIDISPRTVQDHETRPLNQHHLEVAPSRPTIKNEKRRKEATVLILSFERKIIEQAIDNITFGDG